MLTHSKPCPPCLLEILCLMKAEGYVDFVIKANNVCASTECKPYPPSLLDRLCLTDAEG